MTKILYGELFQNCGICVHICVYACICNAFFYFFTVLFRPETAVLFPGGNVTFTCNETDLNRLWIINETVNRRTDAELLNIEGVSSNGLGSTMLIITQSANNTLYGCALFKNSTFIEDTGIVYVASTYICISIYVCMYIHTYRGVCIHMHVCK